MNQYRCLDCKKMFRSQYFLNKCRYCKSSNIKGSLKEKNGMSEKDKKKVFSHMRTKGIMVIKIKIGHQDYLHIPVIESEIDRVRKYLTERDKIIMDISESDYINSMSISIILNFMRRMDEENNKAVIYLKPDTPVSKVVSILNIRDIKIVESLEDAFTFLEGE